MGSQHVPRRADLGFTKSNVTPRSTQHYGATKHCVRNRSLDFCNWHVSLDWSMGFPKRNHRYPRIKVKYTNPHNTKRPSMPVIRNGYRIDVVSAPIVGIPDRKQVIITNVNNTSDTQRRPIGFSESVGFVFGQNSMQAAMGARSEIDRLTAPPPFGASNEVHYPQQEFGMDLGNQRAQPASSQNTVSNPISISSMGMMPAAKQNMLGGLPQINMNLGLEPVTSNRRKRRNPIDLF
jgi:hypothetical protein